jgi:hypothetical protein
MSDEMVNLRPSIAGTSGEAPMMDRPRAGRPWIRPAIAVGAALFILALFLSAVWDPSIRVLHALQALIYIAIVVLTRRNSPWGYGPGVVVSAFWNGVNLFVTTFISNGFEEMMALLQTGRIARPDQFVAVIAATGHFVLIVACLTGFLDTRPRAREWSKFIGGAVLGITYLVAIVFMTGRQFIPLVRRTFGL